MKTPLRLLLLTTLLIPIALVQVQAATNVGIFGHFVSAPDGASPQSPLVQGSDGNFYGTTSSGGAAGRGTIFKATPAGALTTLASFDANVRTPQELIQGADGNFYGTTGSGGASDYGTVYKITPAGVLTTLAAFNYDNGAYPHGKLVQGNDGNFYGTTDDGGLGYGTIFKVTPKGALTILVSFNGADNGAYPSAGLTLGQDGNFYGTTTDGGKFACGTAFKVTLAGVLTTLVPFSGTNLVYPGGLIQGSDGNFYGMTNSGGSSQKGSIFRITPSGSLTTLVSFKGFNGMWPDSELIQGVDGNFYGVTRAGGTTYKSTNVPSYGTVFKMTPSGVLTTLISLDASYASSVVTLAPGQDGDFYGTTTSGGAFTGTPNGGYGAGTLFKMTAAGAVTTIHSFNNLFGTYPTTMTQGSDGNFYGATSTGGVSGYGTLFKLSPGGLATMLASLNHVNSLAEGNDGNFYGTTDSAIFKMTPAGGVTNLAQVNSEGGLIQGSDGNFYGTTQTGGASGNGSVFKMTATGTATTLAFLSSSTTGAFPHHGVTEGSDGNFYGTTGTGTIFKMTPGGTVTLLASFSSIKPSGLVEGANGLFYGTTELGGTSNQGTVFKETSAGVMTTLASFVGSNGSGPKGLVKDLDNNFYGVTGSGGSFGYGTVFKITPSGTLTTLLSLDATNGSAFSGLIAGKDGNLYGTGGATKTGDVTNRVAFEVAIVPPRAQTITFPAVGTVSYGQTVTLGATASSGLPIAYKVLSGPATISGNQVTFTGVATVKLAADQAGNLNFKAASEAAINVSVKKVAQSISAFSSIPAHTYGDAPFTITLPVASSGLPVSVTVKSGPATISGNKITITGAGTVTLMASQAGNATIAAASTRTANFVVNKAVQIITFPAVGTVTHGQTVTLGATASSGLSVTYTVLSGSATVVGNKVTFNAAGTVKLAADQAGNINYKAANRVAINVSVK